MKKETKAKAFIIISMAVFGTLAPFVRNINVSSGELALYRAVMALVAIGLFFIITGQRLPLKEIKGQIPLLLISGAAMGFNWILLFEAYKYTTVATATLSYYFAPVLVTALSPILFKEKLTLKQGLCFGASTLGIILITATGNLLGGGEDFKGIVLGLGAAVLYAGVVLINKFIKNVEGIHRTFLQFMAAAIVVLPYVLLNGGFTLGNLNPKGIICLLTVGLIHTGVAYCMYFSAIKDVSGQKAAILSYVDPLVAIVISVALLKEPIGIWQIIGGGLILGFTLLNEIDFKGGRKNERTEI